MVLYTMIVLVHNYKLWYGILFYAVVHVSVIVLYREKAVEGDVISNPKAVEDDPKVILL